MRSFAGERVLVTGHTGFKGAWLCSWLLIDGAEVAGLALEPEEGRPNLYRDIDLEQRMVSTVGDIRDFDRVRDTVETFQPTVIFHLAAEAVVRRAYASPVATFATNIMGSAHILEAARLCESVRAVVCVTTDKVYQNREWAWGYREIDALGGADPYSASKAAAEMVAGAYLQTLMPQGRLKMATARGGNVLGGGDWAEDRILPDLIRAARAGQPLIVRNPGAVRPWQHVLELVRGYLMLGGKLLDGDDRIAGAWNFGPSQGDAVDVATLIKAVADRWGDGAPTMEVRASPLKETTCLKLDIAKAQAELGWRPLLDFEQTIALTVDWYRSYLADPGAARRLVERQLESYRARL